MLFTVQLTCQPDPGGVWRVPAVWRPFHHVGRVKWASGSMLEGVSSALTPASVPSCVLRRVDARRPAIHSLAWRRRVHRTRSSALSVLSVTGHRHISQAITDVLLALQALRPALASRSRRRERQVPGRAQHADARWALIESEAHARARLSPRGLPAG